MAENILHKSSFVRGVFTLMTGTSVAQALPIAIAPVLTRLYSPENFGTFALFMAITAIITVVSTGRYELAIMLPKHESDAANLVKLSMTFSLIFSALSLVIIFVFKNPITFIFSDSRMGRWIYFIPISVLFVSCYQSLNYWNNRKKQYKWLAINRVLQSVVVAMSQAVVGITRMCTLGLIFGVLVGQGVATLTLGMKTWKEDSGLFKSIDKNDQLLLMKRYSHFPKYDIPSAAINVISQQLPNIFLMALFDLKFAGYFFLTQKVLQAPITLISTSVLDVFKEFAAKSYRDEGNAREIYKFTIKNLFILSVIPTIILFIFVKDIFKFAFGNDWIIAGEYVRILLPALFLRFLANPLSFMFYIAEKQHVNLFLQIVLLSMMMGGFFLSKSHYHLVISTSIAYTIYYIFGIVASAKFAKIF